MQAPELLLPWHYWAYVGFWQKNGTSNVTALHPPSLNDLGLESMHLQDSFSLCL